jgi:PiT family inorganic phosphate transporter
VILASTHFGFPLSTTQVCTGAIIGSGVGKGTDEVRWRLVGRMAGAWVVTLPAAALVGATSFALADTIGGGPGVLVVAVLAAGFIGSIYAKSRGNAVDAGNVNDDWTDYGIGPSGPAPMQVLEDVV